MIQCPQCSAENFDHSRICKSCGEELSSLSQAPTVATPEGEAPSAQVNSAHVGPIVSSDFGPAGGLTPGNILAGRYRIIGLLGRGGMGAVYLAHDLELERNIALKLIQSALSQDFQILQRFKREIQLSSEITHPNVLRVYDLGQSETTRFVTMEFVQGEDLSCIIRREGQLPIERILTLIRQICEGLAAAHEKGILHRDLKPQNIMVDSKDHVYVTDFGLAKTLNQAAITQTGAIMGTPVYMSPEQVKGEKLDLRSDIYSLGMILYEMLTGRKPYNEGSTFEIMVRRLDTPPHPAREIRSDIPQYLLRILDRCIQIDRKLRYGSVSEVIKNLDENRAQTTLIYKFRQRKILKPLMIGLMAALLLAAGIFIYKKSMPSGLPTEITKDNTAAALVLGIIPFENLTGDTSLDWYGEGIARLISDNLAQSRHIQMVSPSRMDLLLKESKDPSALSQALTEGGIGYVVTGEILPEADAMTLTVRLSDTKTGTDIDSHRMDGLKRDGLIKAADQIALAVRRGLNVPITEGIDAYAADFASRNPEAYEAYVAGLKAFVDYNYTDAEKAFENALKIAPEYAMARYRLAHVYAAVGRQDEAVNNIHQAIAESSRLPDREQRYIRAAEAYIARRYTDAVDAYRGIIEAYPYELEARHLLAFALMDNNQPEEAIEPLRFIARMEPEIHSTWSMLGGAYLASRKLNEAVTALRRYVELEPNSANAHHTIADAYRAQREFDLASEEYQKAIEVDPRFYYSQVSLAVLNVLRERYEEAEKRLRTVVENSDAEAGQRIDAAFELSWLRRAQGRFRSSIEPLENLQKEIEAESIREAMALSVRGLSLMEIGETDRATELINRAIEKSPSIPTRYLFARGVLELRQKKAEAVRNTASEILQLAGNSGDINPIAEKAAAYLRGMAFLIEEKVDNAIDELSRAVALEGPEYAIYRLGMARAYIEAKRYPEALAASKQCAGPLDPVNPKLELEIDRIRALLVQAEVQLAMSRKSEAVETARQFLRVWEKADITPDHAKAEEIIEAGR